MTTVPCRHIPGRVHHGACECFRGGPAGEWPHESHDTTPPDLYPTRPAQPLVEPTRA